MGGGGQSPRPWETGRAGEAQGTFHGPWALQPLDGWVYAGIVWRESGVPHYSQNKDN